MDRGYSPTETERAELASHKRLDLSDTRITELPETIGSLTALETLNLGATHISELPETIGNLTALEYLDLSCTRITELPETIGNLTALTDLYLRRTLIASLPESIGNLTALTILDLSFSQIASLPETIGNLPNLDNVNLWALKLDRIPESLALKGLKFNDISSWSNSDSGIYLHGATLSEQDISIFLESPSLIPSLYEDDKVALRECKVIFLGDGGAGKSYTIKRIKNGGKRETKSKPYATSVTHGIEISDWKLGGADKLTVHLWDFGGQDVMHSMHRCFLTEKTCYVITVDSRRNDGDNRVEYWLRNIEAFAKGCPVLLFINCWENSDGSNVIDETAFRERVNGIIRCSARDAGDEEFRGKLMGRIEEAVRSSGFGQQKIARRYYNARLELSKLNAKKPFLTKEEYHEHCVRFGIKDENAADLLTYFNNLGACFSYHKDREEKVLADYRLLMPLWLTNAVYAIIEEGRAYGPEGFITREAINRLLCHEAPDEIDGKPYGRTAPELFYEPEHCGYILDVAEVHELCYRTEGEKVFFPALLSSNTPDAVDEYLKEKGDSVEYRFVYEYLPDNVIHRLMIRCLKNDISVTHPWHRGMMVGAMGDYKAIIRMDNDNTTLRVAVHSAADKPTAGFFELLRREIIGVNDALGLTAKEMIAGEGKDVFGIKKLLNTYRKGNDSLFGDDSDEEYSAYDLLNRFFDPYTIAGMTVDDKGKVRIEVYHYNKKSQNNQLLRKALYHAYGEKCVYCSEKLTRIAYMDVDHILAVNHVDPRDKGTQTYLAELERRGMKHENGQRPDYVENYLPSCRQCNIKKSNEIFSAEMLRSYHGIALKNTPKVLNLLERYIRESEEEE